MNLIIIKNQNKKIEKLFGTELNLYWCGMVWNLF